MGVLWRDLRNLTIIVMILSFQGQCAACQFLTYQSSIFLISCQSITWQVQ
jgi:hypothetical protein